MTAPATYTPAQIAAALNPAQVRGLRARNDPAFLARLHPSVYRALVAFGLVQNHRPSDLGIAVLAELDKGVTA